MIDFRIPTRRGLLTASSAAGAALLLGRGLQHPAKAAAPFARVPEDKALIAFGYVGPISDEGWTWSHEQGRLAVEAAFPRLKTIKVESIPFSAEASRTFKRFVAEGANLIFSTTTYGDLLLDVAVRAPNVAFLECGTPVPSGNLASYFVAHWYPSYIAGVAAGLLSKTGKLGYVASFPVPTVFAGANAFLMGARSVNPAATLQVIAIHNWFDPQGAAQAAAALIDSGADVLFGIMDDPSFLQVAEKRGVKAVTWNTDLRRYGPRAYVSSIVIDFRKYYVDQVRARLDGTWNAESVILPMGSGVKLDAWGESVPAPVRAQADAVRQRIETGWSPFVGEIKDGKGSIRIAAGQRMTEEELDTWNWPIDGVMGI
jgi:basic membrane lipoprotein Med (substrate-binding protein (PBP1-ABC) superfamily)